MMHMFDSVSSSDGEADMKAPVRCVYENFIRASEVAMTTLLFLEQDNRYVALINRILTLKLELKFLRTAFRCMVKWCIEEDGIQRRLAEILVRIQYHFVRANRLLQFYVRKEKFDEVEVVDFDEVVSNVLESVKSMKPEIAEAYNLLYSFPSPCRNPMNPVLVAKFIYLVIDTLEVLLTSSCGAVSSTRKQVLALKQSLKLLQKWIWLAIDQGLDYEKVKEIWIDAEAVADKAAGLSYFLWIDSEVDKKIEIKLTDPNRLQIYPRILETLLHFDRHFPDEPQVAIFEFLQDRLVELLKDEALMEVSLKNQIETLYKELEFFISLSINKSILGGADVKEAFDVKIHIKGMAREVGFVICSFFNSENMAAAISPVLSDLLENIEVSKTKLSAIFSKCLTRERSKFPKVLPMGFFDFLLEDVKELISTKPDMIIDLKDQILEIHADIEFLKSVHQDIKNRPATDVKLKDVVNRITVAAYEAEYLISLSVVSACPVWYRSLWISDFTEEIKLTKAAIVEIIEKTSNGNRISNIAAGQDPNHVPSQAFVPNDGIVEVFQDQMELVKERLARDTKKLDFVSIVGMPGLGKTTLAKRIYEDPLIVHYFDVRGWCYVSPYYEKKEMLLSILSSVIELTDQIRKMKDEQLSEMLYKQLKGRRYLIVMDDLWGLDALEALKRYLPDDSIGSRIMLTSRNKLIGSEAQNHSDPIELRLLTEDESWDLLKAKVFHQETCPWELHHVGKQIAEKCNGLPLAVVVVAGVLAKSSKKQSSWWEVSKNLSSHILEDTEGQAMEVLELSYKLLPDYLKPLFLYLGEFSEYKVIPVRKLTRRWIAEGFVQKTELKSLEDEAEKHLMDLIDRSLVIFADRRSNGRIKTCRMHDLVRDLCLTKVEEENFRQRIYVDLWRKSIVPSRPTPYSLSFSSDGSRLSCHELIYLYKVRCLRVLEFERGDADNNLFAVLGMLVYLRYFSITCYGNSIASSVLSRIVNLWNLETLIVKGPYGIVVPGEIWKLAKLRHLHIDNRAKFDVDDSASENSSKLLNLETFSTPFISHGEEKKLMGRVPNVRKLRCILLGSGDSTLNCNVPAEFVFLDQIESLNVRYGGRVGYPCEFDLPVRLKKLTLSKFRLKWSAISSFQKLPNLEVLKLLDEAVDGELWDVGDDECFPKLKYLKLMWLDIKQWNASSDNFPRLEQLLLRGCWTLVEIPSSFVDICSLASIVVSGCTKSAAKSAKQIQEEQKEYGNELLEVHVG